METRHSVEVECDVDEAFLLCLDVTRWPDIFPPCLDAKIVNETEDSQTIWLAAKANDRVFGWQSKRSIDRSAKTVNFSQSRPSPLVEYMNGQWGFETIEKGCLITLSHEFSVKDPIAGLVEGVTNRDEAADFMLRTIEENSTKELNALKLELERNALRHEFCEVMEMSHTKQSVYQLLRDISKWPWLLPHCNDINLIYEDHCHQEFSMNVQVGDITEVIRSIRILGNDCIDYFQPNPPPALSEHQGRWKVVETGNGVEVVSWHRIMLNSDYWDGKSLKEAKLSVESAINKNSLATMQAINSKLEGVQNVNS